MKVLVRVKALNCQFLGNGLTYEAEIWHLEVNYDADFHYGVEM